MRLPIVIVVALFIFSITAVSFAGQIESDKVDDLVEDFLTSKRQAIYLHAHFDEHEEQPFWTLYDDYEKEIRPVVRSIMRSLYTYETQKEGISDGEADQIIDDLIRMSERIRDIQGKHLAKFRAILPAKKVLHISYVIYSS